LRIKVEVKNDGNDKVNKSNTKAKERRRVFLSLWMKIRSRAPAKGMKVIKLMIGKFIF